MRSNATISGSELLLGTIAFRLAMLVLVGWSLTLLPRQAHDGEAACFLSTRSEALAASSPVGARVADTAFDDMLRHD